ncbi:lipoprotein [Alphaproteobacteria bacterium]|nr:lipoprotein [Alphaproteobacteria bacterium]
MFRSLLPMTALLALIPAAAFAHFQEIIPSDDILAEESEGKLSLSLTFTHPMEGGPVMDMKPPKAFGVLHGGKKTTLVSALSPREVEGKAAYSASWQAKTPGDYIFYLEPAPYWDDAEQHYLIHYAKVVVDFGGGEDWDALVGFPVEIKPLTRPYGLWTGNLFSGVALKGGKPLAGAEVEIEWKNDGSVKAPSDPFVTQLVKTDASGRFSYAIPKAGWWAFNVLAQSSLKDEKGKSVPAEIGGTIWVKAVDLK